MREWESGNKRDTAASATIAFQHLQSRAKMPLIQVSEGRVESGAARRLWVAWGENAPGSFGDGPVRDNRPFFWPPFCGARLPCPSPRLFFFLFFFLFLFWAQIKLHMISNVAGSAPVVGRRPRRGSDNRYILCLSCAETLVRHSPVTRHCHTVWSN